LTPAKLFYFSIPLYSQSPSNSPSNSSFSALDL
jgi:hypothetical protein